VQKYIGPYRLKSVHVYHVTWLALVVAPNIGFDMADTLYWLNDLYIKFDDFS
jgi:hypothetical protein